MNMKNYGPNNRKFLKKPLNNVLKTFSLYIETTKSMSYKYSKKGTETIVLIELQYI